MALFVMRDQSSAATVTLPDGTKINVAPGAAFVVPDQFISVVDGNPSMVWVQPPPVGTTAQRPTGAVPVGAMYWDSTLGKPIWWNGAVWKDSAGTTV